MKIDYKIKFNEDISDRDIITVHFMEFITPADKDNNPNEHLLELAKRRAFNLGANHYDWKSKKFIFKTRNIDKLIERINNKMEAATSITKNRSNLTIAQLITKGG